MRQLKVLLKSSCFLILLSGCWSSPIRHVTPLAARPTKLPIGSFVVKKMKQCEVDPLRALNYAESELMRTCNFFYSELTAKITSSGVLRQLSETESKPDFEIELIELPDRSIHHHGIGPLILFTCVIPFWSTQEYGFLFSIKDNHSGEIHIVDSREKGTTIYWMPAILLNIFPDRIWERKEERETKDLGHRIINALVGTHNSR